MKKLMLLGVIFFMFFNLNGFIVLNDTDKSYQEQSGESGLSKSNYTEIRPIIITSAGYLLEASAYYRIFQDKIELSNLNEAEEKLDLTIDKIVEANKKYYELVSLVVNIPYNENVIDALKNFNYVEFQARFALNPVIFSDLKKYLAEGKITELYTRFRVDTSTITILLFKIKMDLSVNTLKLADIINIEQKITTLILMGQYSALVYQELSGVLCLI